VHVRVVRERRTPGMQYQGCPDPRAQVLGVGGDDAQGLGGDVEQQPVDDLLVVVADGGDRRRQREDDMEVRHG